MEEELEKIAFVNLLQRRSIISLIGNVQYSSLILEKVLCFPLQCSRICPEEMFSFPLLSCLI